MLGVLPMYWLINADVASPPPLSVTATLTLVAAILAGALSGTVGPNMRWVPARAVGGLETAPPLPRAAAGSLLPLAPVRHAAAPSTHPRSLLSPTPSPAAP